MLSRVMAAVAAFDPDPSTNTSTSTDTDADSIIGSVKPGLLDVSVLTRALPLLTTDEKVLYTAEPADSPQWYAEAAAAGGGFAFCGGCCFWVCWLWAGLLLLMMVLLMQYASGVTVADGAAAAARAGACYVSLASVRTCPTVWFCC